MEFEDGMAYELKTKFGILTIMVDSRSNPPIRIYGPDGVQLDPMGLTEFEDEEMFGGYLAFDLSGFSQHTPRRRSSD